MPVAAYRKGGEAELWKYRQATLALKQIAQRVGMDSDKVSLHSQLIGYGSVLAAGGTSEHVTKREGRWAVGTDTKTNLRGEGNRQFRGSLLAQVLAQVFICSGFATWKSRMGPKKT